VLLALERRLTATVAGIAATALQVTALIISAWRRPARSPCTPSPSRSGRAWEIKTIVQATAAPEFLGREGYGALQGSIMTPIYAAQAVSPFAAAMIWQIGGGYDLLERALLLCAVVAAAAFALAAFLGVETAVARPPGRSVDCRGLAKGRKIHRTDAETQRRRRTQRRIPGAPAAQ